MRSVQRGRSCRDSGFTLLELLVSTAILLVVLGALFQVAGASEGIFRTQPRMADMQQRARIAADMLYRDLLQAGTGLGELPGGALVHLLPPIVPGRRGLRGADPDMSFATDRISLLTIGRTRSRSWLMAGMADPAADLHIDAGAPGCPSGGGCGFAASTQALIVDPSGAGAGYDFFTVTSSGGGVLGHAPPNRAFSRSYGTGALVAAADEHVYYLDAETRRLMHYDGYLTDVPLVDDVVGLSFEYLIDPDPRSVPPPAPGAGSCVYGEGDPAVPLLTTYPGAAPRLVGAGQLTDGPVCGVAPNRFDGDLLRVRQVRVTLRVRAEGPGSGDTGREHPVDSTLPDYTIRFDVAPRNLNLIR